MAGPMAGSRIHSCSYRSHASFSYFPWQERSYVFLLPSMVEKDFLLFQEKQYLTLTLLNTNKHVWPPSKQPSGTIFLTLFPNFITLLANPNHVWGFKDQVQITGASMTLLLTFEIGKTLTFTFVPW